MYLSAEGDNYVASTPSNALSSKELVASLAKLSKDSKQAKSAARYM
jgi:hypothetical protein